MSTGNLFGLVGIQSIKEGFLLISAEGRFVFSRQPEHKEYLGARLKMSNEKIEHEEVTKEKFKEAAKNVLLQGFQGKERLENRMPTRTKEEMKLERKD